MDEDTAIYLSNEAIRCRRLAAGIGDVRTRILLVDMAEKYEERARVLRDQFGL